jgi:hypothetical protein
MTSRTCPSITRFVRSSISSHDPTVKAVPMTSQGRRTCLVRDFGSFPKVTTVWGRSPPDAVGTDSYG